MTATLTIQQVAHLTGLSSSTLRYYEQIGLICDITRNASGHRAYTEDDVLWIRVVTSLRDTGMPIAAVQEFSAARRVGVARVPEMVRLMEVHLDTLKTQIEQMNCFLERAHKKLETLKSFEQNPDEREFENLRQQCHRKLSAND